MHRATLRGWTATGLGILAMLVAGCEAPVPPGEQPEPESSPISEPPASEAVVVPDAPEVPSPVTPKAFQLPAVQERVETYELRISEETLAAFEADVWLEEQPATFVYDGSEREVLVRLRGGSARDVPKKSWRIEFPEGTRFDGRRKLNLIAEASDETLMAEKLAYDVLTALGAPSPKAKYVRLVINGEYQGVLLDLERVDKNFLEPNGFVDLDATIYRCGNYDCELKLFRLPYQGKWEKKTNESESDDALNDFVRAVNHTPPHQFEAMLAERMELDHYLRSMAMEALVANAVVEDSQSYFIHDRVTGRWTYVPWDLNNGDARWWPGYPLDMEPPYEQPLFTFTLTGGALEWMYSRRATKLEGYLPAFSNLNTRIATHPALQSRLDALIRRAIDEFYNPQVMDAHLEKLHAVIAPHVADDPYVDQEKFARGADFLKTFVRLRSEFVLQELDRLREQVPRLQIAAFDPQQGWVELLNLTDQPQEIGGLVVTTDLRRPFTRNVPAQILQPGERVRLTEAELGVEFASAGELGVFDGEKVSGVIDLLYNGELRPGELYVRSREAPSGWEVR